MNEISPEDRDKVKEIMDTVKSVIDERDAYRELCLDLVHALQNDASQEQVEELASRYGELAIRENQ